MFGRRQDRDNAGWFEGNLPGVTSAYDEDEFTEAEATVARLASFIHAPGFYDVDPAPDKLFIFARDEVKEAAPHARRRRDQAII